MAPPQPALAWFAAALSGFSALVYEVAFTRLLALVIGPTTYAFATMAAAFITGIAIGSTAGARLSRRVAQPARWLAAAIALTAIGASLAASFAAARLPLMVARDVAAADATFQGVVLGQAFEVALLMLPMTFALGVAFPLALAAASASAESVGRDTAGVYVANTLGAIAGSLVAGFVLVPRFGLHATFAGTSSVAVAGAAAVAGWAALKGGGEARSSARDWSRRRDRGCRRDARRLRERDALGSQSPSSGAYKCAPYIHTRRRRTSRRACVPAASSTTRKARPRRSASAGSTASCHSPSTAKSTRRTPATC